MPCTNGASPCAGASSIRGDSVVKPRIRAITGFITIEPKTYESQIQETVTFLNQVREALKAAGYDVAGIRISTQPFPEYTRGLSRTDGAALLRGVIAECEGRGVAKLHLEVRANNPAVALYAAHGFRHAGVRRNYYRGPGGQAFDAHTYARQLEIHR